MNSLVKDTFLRGEQYIKYKNPVNKIILSSFPRSGNTALRLALSQALQGRFVSVEEIDRVTIDPYASSKKNIKALLQREQSIIKWHGFPMSFHTHNKIIHVYRHPIDTCRSYYTYQRYRHHYIDLKPSEYIEQFLTTGDPSYGRWDYHLHVWKNLCSSCNGVLINFEDLVSNPQLVARSIQSKFLIDDFNDTKFVESISARRTSAKKNKGTDFFKSTEGHDEFNEELEKYHARFVSFIDLYDNVRMI